jgi:hypothetical protein
MINGATIAVVVPLAQTMQTPASPEAKARAQGFLKEETNLYE